MNSSNDDLVIHDGKLITVAQARTEMLAEFPQHGYSELDIQELLVRAWNATQQFLKSLDGFPPSWRQGYIDAACETDAREAAKWRQYWAEKEAEREVREARERAAAEFHRNQTQRGVQEWRERVPDHEAEERARKCRLEHEAFMRSIREENRKADAAFAHWLELNTFKSMLILLKDHDYIDWMFECHKKGWKAPV